MKTSTRRSTELIPKRNGGKISWVERVANSRPLRQGPNRCPPLSKKKAELSTWGGQGNRYGKLRELGLSSSFLTASHKVTDTNARTLDLVF